MSAKKGNTNSVKHGKSGIRLYKIWKSMRGRCNNPRHPAYPNYGARGIGICDKWNEFENFYSWAYSNGYDENATYMECTLDRIDVNGNYEPDNCRFVNWKTQSRNKRNIQKYNYEGGYYSIPELSEISGKPRDLLYDRIVRYGWDVKKAVETKPRERVDENSELFACWYRKIKNREASMARACKELGICYATLKMLMERLENNF